MADIDAGENGGPGGKLMHARCPICRKDEWTPTPAPVFMPAVETPESGSGLTTQPFICQTCGFVALMLHPTQTSQP